VTERLGSIQDVLAGQRDAAIWRNRFITLLDRTPVPTAICLLDGTITGSNPALAALLETTRSHLRGRRITDLLHPRVQRDYERVLRDLDTGRRARRVLTVGWGQGRTGKATVQAVPDENGVGLLLTLQPDPRAGTAGIDLTDRELDILRLVAAGDTSSAIAARLGLTADGVSYHLTRLTGRLGVPNRTALVAKAYTLGLLDPTAWPPR
jgi:DNA-binding CsgD family transcriptional regulator